MCLYRPEPQQTHAGRARRQVLGNLYESYGYTYMRQNKGHNIAI